MILILCSSTTSTISKIEFLKQIFMLKAVLVTHKLIIPLRDRNLAYYEFS